MTSKNPREVYLEEIRRVNTREKWTARYPVSAYLGARMGPASFATLPLVFSNVALSMDGWFAVVMWVVTVAFTGSLLVAFWCHWLWPRRTRERRLMFRYWRTQRELTRRETDRLISESSTAQ